MPSDTHGAVKNGVRSGLTVKRERGTVENKQFAGFARRVVRAFSRRVGQGDVEALTNLLALMADVDDAIRDAVIGLREFGYSWSEIGARAGITKQTAQERWGTARAARTPNALGANNHVSAGDQLSLFAGCDVDAGEVIGDVR